MERGQEPCRYRQTLRELSDAMLCSAHLIDDALDNETGAVSIGGITPISRLIHRVLTLIDLAQREDYKEDYTRFSQSED